MATGIISVFPHLLGLWSPAVSLRRHISVPDRGNLPVFIVDIFDYGGMFGATKLKD